MMASKARLFGDKDAEKIIMSTTDQGIMKKTGRKVKGFTLEVWNKECTKIVRRGNIAKFGQNPDLLKFLLNTGNAVLAEASPYDDIWGIKMGMYDYGVRNPNNWKGTNFLGFTLMEVRDFLREHQGEVINY